MVNDNTFDRVSQNAHLLGGMIAVLIPAVRHYHRWWIFPVLIVVVAAIKEFIYDKIEECPDERGSDARDYFMYLVGCAIGIVITFARGYWWLMSIPMTFVFMWVVKELCPLPPIVGEK